MPKLKPIQQFTGDNVRALSTEATEAIKKALGKYGIIVKYGGGRYGELEFNIKFKLQCESSDGETQAMKDCRRYAEARDLPIQMLGASLNIDGETYQVTGFLPKRRKNNLELVRLRDERKQVCPADYAIRIFNSAQARGR